MTHLLNQIKTIAKKISTFLFQHDFTFTTLMLILSGSSIFIIYSASGHTPARVINQSRNILLALSIMILFANLSPEFIMRFAWQLYIIGIGLLITVIIFGLKKKGATRWLDIGIIMQPSEFMKIIMPIVLAWYYQLREEKIRWTDHCITLGLLMVPIILIAQQPDLGTALLITASGLFVIYFAGINLKAVWPSGILIASITIFLLFFSSTFCQTNIKWPILHNYQKHRICTLLDPTRDPLGKGFHSIQSMIAIGSGGLFGKGWRNGTQSHLEFIPEKHTDFVFSVISEEFGLFGGIFLLVLYTALIFRGLQIAEQATTCFSRLIASSLTMLFFTYTFVNIGMVSGILPIVGVPLPMISYGGTAMVTLGIASGIILSVAKQKQRLTNTTINQIHTKQNSFKKNEKRSSQAE